MLLEILMRLNVTLQARSELRTPVEMIASHVILPPRICGAVHALMQLDNPIMLDKSQRRQL